MSEHKTLVEVQHLQQYFPAGGVGKNRKYVQAVDDVKLLYPSARRDPWSGGRIRLWQDHYRPHLLRLHEPTGGKMHYDGNLLFDTRTTRSQWICLSPPDADGFQDPYASLDPRDDRGDIVGEGIDIHHLAGERKGPPR